MNAKGPPVSRTFWALYAKRGCEFVAAILLLLILSPLLIVTAILIKILDPGPVFFTQPRAGLHGRPFRVIKFRTMRAGRRPDPKELVPLDHPEITNFGRFLRRAKIDELPQLFNVLRGEMALVGPRPTLIDQVERYDEFRRQRLLVKPGVTGLAQVMASAAASWEQRILFDIAYVRRCRLSLDLFILTRTVVVVLRGEPPNPPRFQETRFAPFVDPPEGFEESGSEPAR